ncbi:WbuC family cupin fold metalloprotein [Sedimenticola sp.]|uniref:WbuC family cupin fold metalloprotein n=1 Tax=Sedimenticola sp. TaxID=1940285 RepID=UPI003D107E41
MRQTIDQPLYQQLLNDAHRSPRKRAHLNLHRSYDEPVQRVCIGLVQGTYVRPHAHLQSHQWELILALQGSVGLVIFNPQGRIKERFILTAGSAVHGIELQPGTWHTLYPQDSEAVILEIKQGPYNPSSAAEIAAWAPPEGSEHTDRFLDWIGQAETGSTFF